MIFYDVVHAHLGSKARKERRGKSSLIGGEWRIERDQIGFNIVKQPVVIGLSFLPKDALNFNGSTGSHLDVS